MTKRQIKKQIKKLQRESVFGLDKLKPGVILFNGNSKYEITSEVKRIRFSVYFEANLTFNKKTYSNYNLWIQDYNVINGGYNLYRLFDNQKTSFKYNNLIKKVSKYVIDEDGEDSLEYSIPLSKGKIIDVNTIK